MKIVNIFENAVNEYFNNITYDNVKTKNINAPIVYQCTFSNRLKSIFKNGFSREFTATAGGNFYCTGLYTTYNLESTLNNLQTKDHIYGDAILKIAIQSYERFFICDKKIAQQVYGENYMPEKQIEYLLKDYPKILEKVKKSPYYMDAIQTEKKRTSINVMAFLNALDGMYCLSDNILNKLDIRGFVFYGSNDGYVALIRDFRAALPLEYSLDKGRTWIDSDLTQDRFERIANDYDPIIFLGKDAENYIEPQTYRVINDYMKVQRKTDGKFNFVDLEHNILSPIWFDIASPMDKNHFAYVQLDDELYYISPYGLFENPNDKYPIKTLEDLEEYAN